MTPLDRIAASLRGQAGIWPADTDWNEVLTVAERHGVAVLLARCVPNEILRARVRTATERAFQLARQLRAVVTALNVEGIDVLPVKGPILALTAYGDPATRGVSGDLDLVVRPRDFARALACLVALGYVRHEGAADPVHESEQWQREAHLLPTTLPAAMIELHTDLVGNVSTAPLDLEDVFERSRIEPVLGVPMRVLSVEDQVLYLCLHGARHAWSRLLWVCDVDAVIRSAPSIDWGAVESRAAGLEATQRVGCGVWLAHTLLATPLACPRSLIATGRSHERMAALVAVRMAVTSAGQMPSFRLLLTSELAARQTIGQRLQYLRRQLTPTPRDRAWLRLPRHLSWLHRILRPLRLLTRYGKAYEQGRESVK